MTYTEQAKLLKMLGDSYDAAIAMSQSVDFDVDCVRLERVIDKIEAAMRQVDKVTCTGQKTKCAPRYCRQRNFWVCDTCGRSTDSCKCEGGGAE